jgi:hypothetical protein
LFFSHFANFGFLMILFRERGTKSHTGSGGRGCVERTLWRGGIAIHAKSPLCLSAPRSYNLFNN